MELYFDLNLRKSAESAGKSQNFPLIPQTDAEECHAGM
jgi:hypothetical protein